MLIRTPKLAAALALIGALTGAPTAMGGSTTYFNGGATYFGLSSSPFQPVNGSPNVFENFENGTVNSFVKATGGFIKGPSAQTDSVDAGGSSYATTGKAITFRFNGANGSRPTMAGLAWTDGKPNSVITFRAWDSSGKLIGKITATLGDMMRNGTTGEDRFFGISSDNGISKIRISSNKAGFEVDHLLAYGFSVVPVPPALGLGLAGLAGLGLWRRRSAKKG